MRQSAQKSGHWTVCQSAKSYRPKIKPNCTKHFIMILFLNAAGQFNWTGGHWKVGPMSGTSVLHIFNWHWFSSLFLSFPKILFPLSLAMRQNKQTFSAESNICDYSESISKLSAFQARLTLLPNVKIDWKGFPGKKHSSLFGLGSIALIYKKFYNISTTGVKTFFHSHCIYSKIS